MKGAVIGMRARLCASLAIVATMTTVACASETTGGTPRSLAVQPRVIVEGLLELSALAGSSVVVDELLFHAPAATVQQAELPAVSLLADGAGPLLFRYDASGSDGFGDVLGAERRFTVDDDDGELEVAFAPLNASVPMMSKLEAETGVPLADLQGRTALVHGYLLVTASPKKDGATALGEDCEGDPDGNPALCNPPSADGEDTEGDPDGNPAENDGDPDGNPAAPEGGADDGADDGADGGEGDPDGNPAESDDDGVREGQSVARPDHGTIRAADRRAPRVKVPFLLVLTRAFSLHVPVAGLFATELGDDEVRPLELHVRLDELLSQEVLELLRQEATDNADDTIVVQIANAQAGLKVDGSGVKHRAHQTVTAGGIHIIDGR